MWNKLERDLQTEMADANIYTNICPNPLPGATLCIVSSVCLFPPQHSALWVCPPSTGLAVVTSLYIQRALGASGPVLTGACV